MYTSLTGHQLLYLRFDRGDCTALDWWKGSECEIIHHSLSLSLTQFKLYPNAWHSRQHAWATGAARRRASASPPSRCSCCSRKSWLRMACFALLRIISGTPSPAPLRKP
jgi:hypothetical protein